MPNSNLVQLQALFTMIAERKAALRAGDHETAFDLLQEIGGCRWQGGPIGKRALAEWDESLGNELLDLRPRYVLLKAIQGALAATAADDIVTRAAHVETIRVIADEWSRGGPLDAVDEEDNTVGGIARRALAKLTRGVAA